MFDLPPVTGRIPARSMGGLVKTVDKKFVLLALCEDRPGIVHAVAGFLAGRGCNILDSA